MDAPRSSTRRSALGWTVVAAAVVLNLLKGFTPEVSGMNWPYWAISYRHGFVRRGLVGTLFQSVASGLSVEAQQGVVLRLHYVLLVLLATGVLAWSARLARGAAPRVRALLLTGTAAVFLSMFLPTVGATAGYLDVYVLAVAAGAAFLAFEGRPLAAGLLAMLGPLIHDAFFFLWLPVVCCSINDLLASRDRRRTALRLAPLALPLVSALLVLALHSTEALSRTLGELPVSWRSIQVFEMSLRDAAGRMAEITVARPEQLLLAALYYGWPAAIVAACAAAAAPGRLRRRIVVSALATISPCTILCVAWDLSRFLVWSTYGAFVLLCWSARAARASERGGAEGHRVSVRSQWLSRFALTALVLCGAGGPFVYSFFDYTFADYQLGPRWLSQTPAARISYAWLRVYNRKYVVRALSTADGCPLEGRNIRIDGACVVALGPDARVETRIMVLAPGRYTARIDVAPLDECADATGELAVVLRWRLAPVKPAARFDARSAPTVILDFTIDEEESAMGQMRIAVTTRAGCFRMSSLTVAAQPR